MNLFSRPFLFKGENMDHKPRVFLFDAFALIYRAYYAFINRPMINSKGVNTSAIYGFTTTLFDIMNREKPDFAAVVFDPPSATFRNDLYDKYKANRLSTPEEINKSVPIIKTIIEAFNIPVIEVNGFEADDVIGTLAKQAEKEGLMTYMITPDKDYMQLVSENIKMLKPGKSGGEYELIGIPEVNEFFGVDQPSKVIDILALWGDASDNVPGAPGIGEKSARDLIATYHSLENLMNHTDELKPRQKESLIQNREQVLLSYQLVKINIQVPLPVELTDLAIRKWSDQKLKEIFHQLEFKTLSNRILKDSVKKEPVQGSLFESPIPTVDNSNVMYESIQSVPHVYNVVNSEADLRILIEKLSGLKEFCFDTETTGLIAREAELVGMSFSFLSHEAFYIPVPKEREAAMIIMNMLSQVFANKGIKKIGQNLKFDIQMLMNYKVPVEGELFDTMIAHYLIQPDLKHNLEYLSEIYLGYKMVPIEDLIGPKGPHQKNMRDIEVGIIKEYAGEDADITWQLYGRLKDEIDKKGLRILSETIEMPLIRVLAEMENAGFTISDENLKAYSVVLKNELIGIENSIFDLAGMKFNINSPRQLGEVLFERLQISDGAQKTKTKQYSTGEEILLKIADKHPIINLILDYRALLKLLNTYVDALPKLIDKKTVKIHTSFDQAWVSTGRLSSRNPNLQNIPIRDERGKEIRKAFIPSSDKHILLSADYSQIELRLMAHLSQDENMLAAFDNNADIHVSTAAKIFKVTEEEVTSSMRSKAKTANFGIIYGISSFGLSQRLNISRSEANELIQGYFRSFPRVKDYMENSIKIAREKGFVETIMGRRRFLPDIHSSNAVVRGVAERNAINAPIQGSAADIIKLAMVNLQNKIRYKYNSALILQVHDELILDVLIDELDEIRAIVKQEMEQVMKLRVPLVVDIGVGRNWMEAH
jgi:DNA polymerase-1